MITGNIDIGENVFIDPSSRVNNVIIDDNVKIANSVNIYGSKSCQLKIGKGTYIGPYCMLDGFNGKVTIGSFVSFAQRITLLTGSAPNASEKMQRIFPLLKGEVSIGDHTWIGAHCVIMPKVEIGKYCVVAANSFVNQSFPDYSILGGSPAKLLRKLTEEEIKKLHD
jgi:acetyltransferase-like isoleucine patch superfamily enzyme